MWKILLLLAAGMASCNHGKSHDEVTPAVDARVSDLQSLYEIRKGQAVAMKDPADGWIEKGCDGMIWNARYALVDSEVNILAAEYPDTPGKFGRRPAPWCWTAEGAAATPSTNESASTWSRDMGIAGLIPYAFLSGRRDILERHAAYVSGNGWSAGEPFAEGRTVYTPQMIGILYKAIHGLGGAESANEAWPAIYPSGLTDYELHLEVSDIFLTGRIAAALNDPAGMPKQQEPGLTLAVTGTMYDRLVEAAAAEPNDPFYSFVLGQYSGSQAHTLDLLLDPAMPMAHYVRCGDDNLERCTLAQWLFVAHLTLEALKPK